MRTSLGGSTAVDLTAVGRKDLRARVLRELQQMESTGAVDEFQDFWGAFFESSALEARRPMLVIGDLAAVVRKFRNHDVHQWTTSVRKSHCYFLTFVRTELDKRYAAWVDDIVKASDLRFDVCNDVRDWSIVTECLRSAVSALRPDAILGVHFLPERKEFWMHFGDGKTGVLTLEDISLQKRKDVIPESATVGDLGMTIELTTASGDLFEIDSTALRSLIDEDLRKELADQNRNKTAALGEVLRAKRDHAGLTQVQLGEQAGLDQAVISRIERGRVRPRIDTLRQIARALDLTVGELLSPLAS